MARTLPMAQGDQLLLALPAGSGATLERWQVKPPRRLAVRSVPFSVSDLAPNGRTLLLQSQHHLDTLPIDLSTPPSPIWRTTRTILRTVAFRDGWLALASEGTRDGHPHGGLVYLLSPATKRSLSGSSAVYTVRALALLPRYNFWEMQVGDVDGDGRPEIALCTWSKTRRIPTYARRYFIYGWNGRDVFPRWRGSRLSQPYRQTRLIRIPEEGADTKLLSVEETRAGRRCLCLYRWADFGFTGLAQSADVDAATILDTREGPPLARVVRKGTQEELCAIRVERSALRLEPLCSLYPDSLVVAGRFHSGGPPQTLVFRAGRVARARLIDLSATRSPGRSE